MSDPLPHRLWADDASKRFYLVPEDAKLPPGPLRLRAGATRYLEVDPAAVEHYEVPREEAKAWLDARFGEWVDGTRESLAGLFRRVREAGSRPAAEETAAPAGEPPPPGPGTKLFSAVTGVTDEDLEEGAEGFARGLRNLLGEARPPGGDAKLQENAERLERLAREVDRAAERARARLRSTAEALNRLDRPLPPEG